MSQTLKVAIVGCGNIADNHYQAYASFDDVEVVAVVDTNAERARAFADARGIPEVAGSLAELSAHEVQAISVCTPHPTHESVVLEAAALGLHILCEKPLSVGMEAAKRMVEAAEAAGVVLGTVFQRRFWPAAQKLRTAVEDGRIGDPLLGNCSIMLHRGPEYYAADPWRGTWDSDGGGVLMTQGIHYVDLLQWYMGDAVEVFAQAGTLVLQEHIEVEDTLVATVKFASGALATIQATVGASPSLGARVSVTGRTGATGSVTEYPDGGVGITDLWSVAGEQSSVDVYAAGIGENLSVAQINAGLAPYHRIQLRDFVTALQSGTTPAVTGRDALASLAIVEAIYESARTGAPVSLATSTNEGMLSRS